MQVIRELAEQMLDEVRGAKEYSEAAMHYKYEMPELAKAYHEMAADEFRHVDMLHKSAVDVIKKVKESGIQYPPSMQRRWDEEHKGIIEANALARQYFDLWEE